MADPSTTRREPALAGLARRYRWLIAGTGALLLYAAAGFLLLPWVIKREVAEYGRETLGRETSVERVAVNPFALSLRIKEFRLRDRDGSMLISVGGLAVNFEAESLVRRAWTFSEVAIRSPYVNLVRNRSGGLNLLALLPQTPAAPAAVPADAGPPRLILRKLRLADGRVALTDEMPDTAFHTEVGPVSLGLDEISTLPDESGHQQLNVTLESGTRITVAGDVELNPFHASGKVTAAGPALSLLSRYLQDQLQFRFSGEEDLTADFDVGSAAGGGLAARVTNLAMDIRAFELNAPAAPGFLRWSSLRIDGGQLAWPARAVSARSVTVAGLRGKVRRDAHGQVDVVRLFTAPGAPPAVNAPAPPAAPAWAVRIDEARLSDAAVEFADESPATPAVLVASDMNVTLRDVSGDDGAKMPLQAHFTAAGGTVDLQGTVMALPDVALDAEVKVAGLALGSFQPYLDGIARVAIRRGSLAADGHLRSGPDESLAYDGDLRILELETQDTVENRRLIAWKALDLNGVEAALDRGRLTISRATLAAPFARIFINRDHTTNVGALLLGPPAPSAEREPPAPARHEPARVRVGRIAITGGETDFTDLSLPLPFAAQVTGMKGQLTAIDSGSAAPSRINLEGQVEPYGLARVSGTVSASSPTDLADVAVVFRNIEMPPLSPYTVKFAGRKIARGKINLDLRYQLKDRELLGQNKIVIDELELGDKVPSPDAVDLPLGLAVALLKDADGRIDVDMPVSGSLDDPQFGIGKVIWNAFVNLVTRVATAPFRLLGQLVGVDSEDLGRIDFQPGRADVLPPEREKLVRVAEALARRPELAVSIPAVVDPKADSAVLREAAVDALVADAVAAAGKPVTGRRLEQRTREAVESLYESRFPDQPLEAIEAQYTMPPPDDPNGRPRLDELAYVDALRARLATAMTVSAADLDALGQARADGIRAELAGTGQVAPERLHVGKRRDVGARDGDWVGAELGLSGAPD